MVFCFMCNASAPTPSPSMDDYIISSFFATVLILSTLPSSVINPVILLYYYKEKTSVTGLQFNLIYYFNRTSIRFLKLIKFYL